MADKTGVEERFVDGLAGIRVTGNLVRVDLGSLAQLDEAGGMPEPGRETDARLPLVPRVRLVMTAEAFGQVFGVLEQTMQALLERGVLRRTVSAVGQRPVAAGSEVDGERPKPAGSPNFPDD